MMSAVAPLQRILVVPPSVTNEKWFKRWHKKKEEEKGEEDVRKFVDEETKDFDDKVETNVRHLKETQLEHWKEAIMNYIEDSKALRPKNYKMSFFFIGNSGKIILVFAP